MVGITCFLLKSSALCFSFVGGLNKAGQGYHIPRCLLPQRGSSHSRACTRACHWPSRIFPQLGCCHSQSSRSVSDASSGFLPGYTHCWILAGKRIKIKDQSCFFLFTTNNQARFFRPIRDLDPQGISVNFLGCEVWKQPKAWTWVII